MQIINQSSNNKVHVNSELLHITSMKWNLSLSLSLSIGGSPWWMVVVPDGYW